MLFILPHCPHFLRPCRCFWTGVNLTTLNMSDMPKTLSMSPGVFTLHTQTLFFSGKSKEMESMCYFTQRMARPSLSSVQVDAPLVRKPRQHGVAYPAYHVRWDIGLPYTYTHTCCACVFKAAWSSLSLGSCSVTIIMRLLYVWLCLHSWN